MRLSAEAEAELIDVCGCFTEDALTTAFLGKGLFVKARGGLKETDGIQSDADAPCEW